MRSVAALTLALVLASGCRIAAPASGDVPTFTVAQSEPFVRRLRADGTLRAVEATPVVAPQDARGGLKIASLLADGSRVEAGDVVITFDPSDMERQLADSQDDVTSATRQIGKVGAESAAKVEKRERTAVLAEYETEVAKEFESHDERVLSRIEMLEDAIDLELAQAKAEHARRVKPVEKKVAASQRELHEISAEHHRREVEHATQGLQSLQVVAPHPGILVLARGWRGDPVRIGDTVWPGQKLAELPLLSAMEAEVYVLESDAGDLVEGLTAEVVIDAHPSITWPAKVARVDTLAQPRHPDVPVHYFRVTLAFERTDVDIMRVGQRVRATIVVERPAAIIVPRQAVFEKEGKTIVYRKGDDGFASVEVTLGASSAGRVVIASGLVPGDEVALRDPDKAAGEILADSEGASPLRLPGGPS